MPIFKIVKRGIRLLIDSRLKEGDIIHEQYVIKSFLGMGSYGMTYLCIHIQTNKQVVLKQMTRSKRKKEILAQYHKEVSILRQLDHSKIPKLYDSFSLGKINYLIMEYIDGENLEELLFFEKKRFNEKECLSLFRDIILIVAYIHSQGIVHGDIRIPNVILKDSKPYLIDFGLATRCSDSLEAKDKVALFRADYYDLGDFLLFLLYSTYNASAKKGRSWMEELQLHPQTRQLVKRLLGIDQPYAAIEEIIEDIILALKRIGDF